MDRKKYGVIYKITNITNNKVYVGITTSRRGFKGRYSAKGNGIERVYNFYKYQKKNNQFFNVHLLNSISKYGFNSFKVDEAFDVAYDKNELKLKEKYWIKYYNSNNIIYGYNRTEGGDAFLCGEDHPRYNTIEFECDICGNKTSQQFAKYKRSINHYCSTKCKYIGTSIFYSGENNHMYNRFNVACNFCKDKILKPKSLINTKNYCSQKCKNEHQKQTMKGKNNPNYANGKKIIGVKNGRARRVVCVNTNEVFEYMLEAATKYNTKNSYIGQCCSGKQKTAGKLPITNEGLRWMYYDDYIKQLNETKLIHN